MISRKTAAWAMMALAPCLFCLSARSSATEMTPAQTKPIQIGMAQTMFVDVSKPLVDLLTVPFGAMMKQFTGLDGGLVVGGEALEVARKLDNKAYDLAVFQGVEFAWAKSKFENLEPLMVVLYQNKNLHVHLVTCKDCQAAGFADLKGKILAMPRKSKEHCRLFLERYCADCGEANPRNFFGKVVNPSDPETTLDELLDGKYEAAIIDKVSLDFYEFLKPGAFSNLKVVKTSESFPPAVIAYRKGAMPEEKLNVFRDGLIKAAKNQRTRDLMVMMRITSFEAVPENFQQQLDDILKAYPAPELPVKTSRNP